MSLLETIAEDKAASDERAAKEKSAALLQYREIIQRHDHPEPGDADMVRSLFNIIGKDVEDLEADILANENKARLESRLISEKQKQDAKTEYDRVMAEAASDLRATGGAMFASGNVVMAAQNLMHSLHFMGHLTVAQRNEADSGARAVLDKVRAAESKWVGVTNTNWQMEAALTAIRKTHPFLFTDEKTE